VTGRLYVLLAREVRRGVIFRRGPSKYVLLISWDLQTDTFTAGQWLKGKVYERRSDLSPRGDLLLYFAGNQRPPYGTWTAISRPPYFTALALWPKGDTWGGGGHFLDQSSIALNHPPGQSLLAEGFHLPPWMKVEPFGTSPGAGEDDPIWIGRLERDGWRVVSHPSPDFTRPEDGMWARFEPPHILEKPHPGVPGHHVLRMIIRGLNERNGPWYVTEHELVSGTVTESLGRTEWADWDLNGDLLFTRAGALYRRSLSPGALAGIADAVRIADFSDLTFEPQEPSAEARRWPARGHPSSTKA
jgi:hypothetical protein